MNCHCGHSKEEHNDGGMCGVCLCGDYVTPEELKRTGEERLKNCEYKYCAGKLLQSQFDVIKKENQSFGNVLAIIHRDGGHYITEHGHDKASKDAIKIVLNLRAQLDEIKEREKQLQYFVSSMRDIFSYNEYSVIDMNVIFKCFVKADCDIFTKDTFSDIIKTLIKSGLSLLPTTNKAIKLYGSNAEKQALKN